MRIIGVVVITLVLFGAGWAVAATIGFEGRATIGGHAVSNELACEEDEVIAFVGVDAVGCVHFEDASTFWWER